MRPIVPKTLAISDRQSLRLPFVDWLAYLHASGTEALQLREKDLVDIELLDLARTARATLDHLNGSATKRLRLLINGRVDIALASGADGIHLPSTGLPVQALRRRFGSELLIGVSTHDPGEVESARQDGADYVTFGPVYPTPSKAAFGRPPGLEGLREACRRGLPVLALGGVSAERVEEVLANGATGYAGIRLFQGSGQENRM